MRGEKVREIALEAGLVVAGVAGTGTEGGLRERLEKRLQEGRVTPFEERETERRLNPGLALPGCRSMIMVGSPYLAAPEPGDSALPADGPRGEVARCARGADYHLLLEQRALALVERLRRELPGPLRCRFLCDRSPLVEREAARQAGAGWIGENCALAAPNQGSFIALGAILLDIDLEPGGQMPDYCLHCGCCRGACPTGALVEPYILDPYRCLSYITQASGVVPAPFRPLMGVRLYGCDRCQEVCPHNRVEESLSPGHSGSLSPGPFLNAAREGQGFSFPFFPASPILLPLLRMSRQEFAHTVGLTAAGWRGRTVLQRNAVIALGNSGCGEAVPDLARLLKEDPRPVIRLHAAWALGALGGARARYYLERCLWWEQNPEVLAEANKALET